DYWGWDGERWLKQATTDLSMMGFRMTYDSKRQRPVLLGGIINRSQPIGDLRVWISHQWVTLKAWPELRAADAGVCYDPDRDRIIAVVRNEADHCLDTYEWGADRWSKSKSVIPGLIDGYSIVYDKKRKCTVLI